MLEFAPLTRRVSEDILEKMSGPFKVTDTIRFNLVGTNTSLITLPVRRLDPYSQNKPRLLRDNQELAYRKDMVELIKRKHTIPQGRRSRGYSTPTYCCCERTGRLIPRRPLILGVRNLTSMALEPVDSGVDCSNRSSEPASPLLRL
jgi:hypothetical protein